MFAAMITLSQDVETLARRVAAFERTTVEDAIRRALEDRAQANGVVPDMRGRRMTAEQMLALGAEIAAMPLLAPRNHGRSDLAMIVVDSSALVAILENEVDAPAYAKAIERADRLLISVNVHEIAVVQHGAPQA
jgi:antitoxin VapB